MEKTPQSKSDEFTVTGKVNINRCLTSDRQLEKAEIWVEIASNAFSISDGRKRQYSSGLYVYLKNKDDADRLIRLLQTIEDEADNLKSEFGAPFGPR